MNKRSIIGLALAGAIATSAALMAAVTFDPATGYGFVGKGDVQLVYGWNNKALQDHADDVEFRVNSRVVTEISWICTNTNNETTQERERTTTTTVQGVLESVARERNQVTGFILNGYDGDSIDSSTTDGPPLNSCPAGPWTLTSPAGEPVVVSEEGGGLEVSIDGINWYGLGQ
jgi:hypothetical protein